MVHSEVYAVLYTCLPWLLSKCNINIENCSFCMLFNFSSIFPGGVTDPICPYVRTPMLITSILGFTASICTVQDAIYCYICSAVSPSVCQLATNVSAFVVWTRMVPCKHVLFWGKGQFSEPHFGLHRRLHRLDILNFILWGARDMRPRANCTNLSTFIVVCCGNHWTIVNNSTGNSTESEWLRGSV